MQKHFSAAITPPTLTFDLSIIKRSQSFSKLLPLYCERFIDDLLFVASQRLRRVAGGGTPCLPEDGKHGHQQNDEG